MSRGTQTRSDILSHALNHASRIGLSGLSIGTLARDVGMSKSGLFAHFGSKEELQRAVLESAAERFVAEIILPAIKQPRGLPRVRALFENWVVWSQSSKREGGCLFVSGSSEFDDRPGVVRDLLAQQVKLWLKTLERAASLAITEGHFHPDTDAEQFAFKMHAYMLEYNVRSRLFRDPNARARTTEAFVALVADVQDTDHARAS